MVSYQVKLRPAALPSSMGANWVQDVPLLIQMLMFLRKKQKTIPCGSLRPQGGTGITSQLLFFFAWPNPGHMGSKQTERCPLSLSPPFIRTLPHLSFKLHSAWPKPLNVSAIVCTFVQACAICYILLTHIKHKLIWYRIVYKSHTYKWQIMYLQNCANFGKIAWCSKLLQELQNCFKSCLHAMLQCLGWPQFYW